jgi:tagaturonate reductase
MVAYSNSVLERYLNPYVRHELMSIALNSCSKFKERDLPTILQYIERTGKLPVHGLFSLAALISFYKGVREINGTPIALNDDPKFIEFFKNEWASYDGTKDGARKIVKDTLALKDHWGQDLNNIPGVQDFVTEALYAQQTMPMRDAIKAIIK